MYSWTLDIQRIQHDKKSAKLIAFCISITPFHSLQRNAVTVIRYQVFWAPITDIFLGILSRVDTRQVPGSRAVSPVNSSPQPHNSSPLPHYHPGIRYRLVLHEQSPCFHPYVSLSSHRRFDIQFPADLQ